MKNSEGLALPSPRPQWWDPLLEKLTQGTKASAAFAELGLTWHKVTRYRETVPEATAEYAAALQAGRWADVMAVLPDVERLVRDGTPVARAFAAHGIDRNRKNVYLRNHPEVRAKLNELKSSTGVADHRLTVGWLRGALEAEAQELRDSDEDIPAITLVLLRMAKAIVNAADATGTRATVAELRGEILTLVAETMAHREDMPQMLRQQLGLEDEDDEE